MIPTLRPTLGPKALWQRWIGTMVAICLLALADFVLAPAGAERMLLKGRVEHSERMPPLEASLSPGKLYRQGKTRQPVERQWYRIPAWFAGTWATNEETVITTDDLRKGKQYRLNLTREFKSMHGAGLQRDADGAIWDFDRSPTINRVVTGNLVLIQMLRSSTPLIVSEKEVVLLCVGTQVIVDANRGRIQQAVQSESIQRYVPAADGRLRCETSLKSFDHRGIAVRLDKSVHFQNRMRPFQPQDQYNGANVLASFRQFLVAHGLSQLVPR